MLVQSLSIIFPPSILFIYLLNRRLVGPHPLAKADTPPPKSEWKALGEYTHINMKDSFSQNPSQRGYVVVGGCGMVGAWIVRLLLLREEKHVRVADVAPLPADLSGREGIEYRKTDITSRDSVEALLITPFSDGTLPSVVIHTAALIRFWERRAYAAHVSENVNLGGTRNLLDIAACTDSIDAFVYTSSASVANNKPLFMRFGLNQRDKSDILARDDIMGNQNHHYPRTKRIGDAMVCSADGNGGVRTTVLRPGMVIMGPGDLFGWQYMSVTSAPDAPPFIPIFGNAYSQHAVNVQDLAAAHILAADALDNPDKVNEIGGKGFMVTSDPAWYDFGTLREMIQYFSSMRIPFKSVPPIVIYAIGHLIELLLVIRWYLLSLILSLFGVKTRVSPAWLGPAESLQPSMFETALLDVSVDDSRIRKVLGYKHAWSTIQSIHWVTDEFQKSKQQKNEGYFKNKVGSQAAMGVTAKAIQQKVPAVL